MSCRGTLTESLVLQTQPLSRYILAGVCSVVPSKEVHIRSKFVVGILAVATLAVTRAVLRRKVDEQVAPAAAEESPNVDDLYAAGL